MNEIYFETKGESLLETIGMTKAEFARRMGIQRQNVKALFRSKDLRVIHKAADVLGVPWQMLASYVDESKVVRPHKADPVFADEFEILPEDTDRGQRGG